MDIKPIETTYNGYRFRSRLEARWAVFFDACGIPYEYETEGYLLPDGSCYLPDFYLPWFKAFVEVKRKNLDDEDIELAKEKLQMLFESTSIECIGMLCLGDPADNKIQVLCRFSDADSYGIGWFDGWFYEGAWYRNRKDIDGHDPVINNPEEYGYTKHCITLNCETGEDAFCMTNHYNECTIECRNRLKRYRNDFQYEAGKARKARFEHGESGYNG